MGCVPSHQGLKDDAGAIEASNISPTYRPFMLMNPTRFLSRAIFFPFQVGFMGEGGSTPQMRTQHPAQDPGGSNGLDLEGRSSESTVGNKTEYIIITRKFHTANLRNR